MDPAHNFSDLEAEEKKDLCELDSHKSEFEISLVYSLRPSLRTEQKLLFILELSYISHFNISFKWNKSVDPLNVIYWQYMSMGLYSESFLK